jgi:hypothetical protein
MPRKQAEEPSTTEKIIGAFEVKPGERGQRANLKDVNLLERAVRAGWIIPEEAAKFIPADLVSTYKASKSSRARIAIAKCLDAMKRTELASVDTALRARAQTELDGEMAALKARIEGGRDHVDSVDADRGETVGKEGPASQASPDVG